MTKDACIEAAQRFKARHSVDATDENVIAMIHIMNAHGLDVDAAQDQSSKTGSDHGIDAWHLDLESQRLFVYQSKLSASKKAVLKAFSDLQRAGEWLEQVLIDRVLERPPQNSCLWALRNALSETTFDKLLVHFIVLSRFGNEVEDEDEYEKFVRSLVDTRLNKVTSKIEVSGEGFNLERGVPKAIKRYSIPRIPEARIDLRENSHLEIAFVALRSLVQLYRQRGDILFDKNVRLSLIKSKQAQQRLRSPMENTLEQIVDGTLSASIFPFYHVGVTISASIVSTSKNDAHLLEAETPSVINGCQTIAIADEFLRRLEKRNDKEALSRFDDIKVIAKIVVGTSQIELKEITNANNRQNPIENWQLFSNEPIHIEIETALRDVGVFYERQKGKFEAIMRKTDEAKLYPNTKGTYVSVMDLGQSIALSRSWLSLAAKPSDIFATQQSHDKVFDKSIPTYPSDIIFVTNAFKAMKRGLHKYLKMPTVAQSYSPEVFKKAIVRQHAYRLTLLRLYAARAESAMPDPHKTSLAKKAPTTLVDEVENIYRSFVRKTTDWYRSESQELDTEVSARRITAFFDQLISEFGLDPTRGPMPFTERGLDASLTEVA